MPGDRTAFRAIPSVEKLLEERALRDLVAEVPRGVVLREVRALLGALREGGEPALLAALGRGETDALTAAVAARARAAWRPGMARVVNATGIVLHTNLGRAPLGARAIAAVAETAGAYASLEYDPATGERASRLRKVSGLIADLAGAEDALAVNNNAAALLLALNTLAAGREVVVSRGELIEIGDSFRIPEILAKSGADIVEVGTTNRTYARDYARAIGRRTALLLKIHRSNFRIEGFVSEATVEDLAALGSERAVPVVEDLGSGAVVDLAPAGVREPSLADSIAKGASLVTASGDKLLGGPQAGIVAGRADLVRAMKANPLFRALRVDKLTLAALEATLRAFYDADGGRAANPTVAMLSRSAADLERDARALAARIELGAGWRVSVALVPAESEAGGGAQPVVPLPTVAVAVQAAGLSADALATRLRAHGTPIVARIREDVVLLDPRTLLEGDAERIGAFFDGFGRDGSREDA